jgi:hypothetical protein
LEAVFGWIFFVVVLRAGFAVLAYPYDLILDLIELGIALGIACGFAALAFTGPVETKKDDDGETPKA